MATCISALAMAAAAATRKGTDRIKQPCWGKSCAWTCRPFHIQSHRQTLSTVRQRTKKKSGLMALETPGGSHSIRAPGIYTSGMLDKMPRRKLITSHPVRQAGGNKDWTCAEGNFGVSTSYFLSGS